MDTKGWDSLVANVRVNFRMRRSAIDFCLLRCPIHREHTRGGGLGWVSPTPWSLIMCQPIWLMNGGAHPQHPRPLSPSCFWLSLSFSMCVEMPTGKERFAVDKQLVPTGFRRDGNPSRHGHSQSLDQSRHATCASEKEREPRLLCTRPQPPEDICFLLVVSCFSGFWSQQRPTLVSPCHSHSYRWDKTHN